MTAMIKLYKTQLTHKNITKFLNIIFIQLYLYIIWQFLSSNIKII